MGNFSIDTGTISALESFMKYGPLGFAGLMLLLVIIGLSLGTLTPAKIGLLRTFLFVGAACFLAALAAQFFSVKGEFELRVTVLPQDMGSQSSFPPPIIRLNGEKVERPKNDSFRISANTSVLVDVSDAVGRFKANEEVTIKQTEALELAREQTQVLSQRISTMQTSGTSPSGIQALQKSLKSINRTLILP